MPGVYLAAIMRPMEQNLRIPGPTPIPDEVRAAQSAPMINHRGPEFAEMLLETSAGIGQLIGTDGDVFLLTGSGTGSMEAAVVNTLSPGDRVLAVVDRCVRRPIRPHRPGVRGRGRAVGRRVGHRRRPGRLAAHLAANAPYKAVLLTHNETSTGVANPLRELAASSAARPASRSSWWTASAAWGPCRSRWTPGAWTS